jgi:hypothetical protein
MKISAQIIAGGGWKKTRGQKIKVKFWSFFLFFVLLAGIGFSYIGEFGVVALLPAGVPLMISIVLFFREKPSEVEWPDEHGSHDPRKLYGRGG